MEIIAELAFDNNVFRTMAISNIVPEIRMCSYGKGGGYIVNVFEIDRATFRERSPYRRIVRYKYVRSEQDKQSHWDSFDIDFQEPTTDERCDFGKLLKNLKTGGESSLKSFLKKLFQRR